MSSVYTFNVTVFRDSLSTPWGFRLEGGSEFQAPLVVQRVFQGSPVAGDLQRGDIILAINNRDTTHISHQEANDLIKNGGGSISFTIKRGIPYPDGSGHSHAPHSHPTHAPNFYEPPPQPTPIAAPKTHHHSYASSNTHEFNPFNMNPEPYHLSGNEFNLNYLRNRVIEKPKEPKPILSQTGSPYIPGCTGMSYQTSNSRLYKPHRTAPLFSSAPALPSSHALAPSNRSAIVPQAAPPTVPPPYAEKEMISKIQTNLLLSASKHQHQHHQHHQHQQHHQHHHQQEQQYPHHYEQVATRQQPISAPHVHHPVPLPKSSHMNVPYDCHYVTPYNRDYEEYMAMKKNLFSGHQPSEAAVSQSQKVIYTQHQASDNSVATSQNQQPKLVNNQYNSPIGLYSKGSLSEEISKQTSTGLKDNSIASTEF